MTRRTALFSASAALLVGVAATLAHGQTTGDALDPVRVAADTHRVAFENAFVRILDVHIPPGKTEPRHRHPHGLSVYFSDWEAKVTVDGKPAQVNARKNGTFAWSDAVVHTVENVGKAEAHVLRIRAEGTDAADAKSVGRCRRWGLIEGGNAQGGPALAAHEDIDVRRAAGKLHRKPLAERAHRRRAGGKGH